MKSIMGRGTGHLAIFESERSRAGSAFDETSVHSSSHEFIRQFEEQGPLNEYYQSTWSPKKHLKPLKKDLAKADGKKAASKAATSSEGQAKEDKQSSRKNTIPPGELLATFAFGSMSSVSFDSQPPTAASSSIAAEAPVGSADQDEASLASSASGDGQSIDGNEEDITLGKGEREIRARY
jgi:hypothetical protein